MEHLCRWLHRMGPAMTWLPPRLPWQPSAMLVAANRASVATRCTLAELRDYAQKGAILLLERPDFAIVRLADSKQLEYKAGSGGAPKEGVGADERQAAAHCGAEPQG